MDLLLSVMINSSQEFLRDLMEQKIDFFLEGGK